MVDVNDGNKLHKTSSWRQVIRGVFRITYIYNWKLAVIYETLTWVQYVQFKCLLKKSRVLFHASS